MLKISDEEKKRILNKHKESIKNQKIKKEDLNKGLQSPKKENNKKSS